MSRYVTLAFSVMLLAVACSYPSPSTFDGEEPGPTKARTTKDAGSSKSDDDAVLGTESRRTGDTPSAPSAPLSCVKDVDCNSSTRICEANRCVKGTRSQTTSDAGTTPTKPPTTPKAPECTDDFDCELGDICTQSRCVAGCHTDFDCPLDSSCNFGQCEVDRVLPATPVGGTSCNKDGDCNPGNDGSGKICTGGTCVAGCRQDNQCPGVTICIGGFCR